jgi:hypothetical protein
MLQGQQQQQLGASTAAAAAVHATAAQKLRQSGEKALCVATLCCFSVALPRIALMYP